MNDPRPDEQQKHCRFFHLWSPWTDTGRRHKYWFIGLGGSGEYCKAEQVRQCTKCNALDSREVRS